MESYNHDLTIIQGMLRSFVRTKTIDVRQLSKMDALIKASQQSQIKVLNSALPLDIQRIVFGAVRNIYTTVQGMKNRLKDAAARHENPTVAEQAMDVMESLFNVVSCVDSYLKGGKVLTDAEEIDKMSRVLYKKAMSYNFCVNQQEQLRKAGITKEQVASFINSFDSSLSRELEIEEEVKSKLENSS
jgi:hypothetical protein